MKAFFVWLFRFALFSFLSIGIGLIIGSVIVKFDNKGAFVSWRLLSGSMKFEKIVEATSHIVWAQTMNGSIYSKDIYCGKQTDCEQWIKIEQIPTTIQSYGEQPIERQIICNFDGFEYHKELAGKSIECIRTGFAGSEFGSIVYYVLLEDGTIWAWAFNGSMISNFVIPIICAFLGFIIGIVAFIFYLAKSAS